MTYLLYVGRLIREVEHWLTEWTSMSKTGAQTLESESESSNKNSSDIKSFAFIRRRVSASDYRRPSLVHRWGWGQAQSIASPVPPPVSVPRPQPIGCHSPWGTVFVDMSAHRPIGQSLDSWVNAMLRMRLWKRKQFLDLYSQKRDSKESLLMTSHLEAFDCD